MKWDDVGSARLPFVSGSESQSLTSLILISGQQGSLTSFSSSILLNKQAARNPGDEREKDEAARQSSSP